jgi:hypothetical protein
VSCGSNRNVEVGHLDKHEENTRPVNLVGNCRSCNTELGVLFKHLGIGSRTRQLNPKAQGARDLAQWLTPVVSMKGESSQMSVPEAVAMVRTTPTEDRSAFWD